jgi:hypothetical protein
MGGAEALASEMPVFGCPLKAVCLGPGEGKQ